MTEEAPKPVAPEFVQPPEGSSVSTPVEPVKYTRKPFGVDAVRVNAENMTDVAEWCGGKIEVESGADYIKIDVARPMNDRQTKAFAGDWVLYAGSSYKVYSHKAFSKSFEKVADTPSAPAEELRTVADPS